jgi:hypothetical protein
VLYLLSGCCFIRSAHQIRSLDRERAKETRQVILLLIAIGTKTGMNLNFSTSRNNFELQLIYIGQHSAGFY